MKCNLFFISQKLLTRNKKFSIIILIKFARANFGKEVKRLSPLKKGQKLTDNPKNVRLEIRMTKEENDLLMECAEKLNTTRTDIIIRGIKLVKEEIDKK